MHTVERARRRGVPRPRGPRSARGTRRRCWSPRRCSSPRASTSRPVGIAQHVAERARARDCRASRRRSAASTCRHDARKRFIGGDIRDGSRSGAQARARSARARPGGSEHPAGALQRLPRVALALPRSGSRVAAGSKPNIAPGSAVRARPRTRARGSPLARPALRAALRSSVWRSRQFASSVQPHRRARPG